MLTLPGYDEEGDLVVVHAPTLRGLLGLAAVCFVWVGVFLSLASYMLADRVDPIVALCTLLLGTHRTALGISKLRERVAAEVSSPVPIGRQRPPVRAALIASAVAAGGIVGWLMSNLAGATMQTALIITALLAAWETAYVFRQGPLVAAAADHR